MWDPPAVVDEHGHGGGGWQGGEVQVDVLHPRGDLAHAQQLIQQHVEHRDAQADGVEGTQAQNMKTNGGDISCPF